MTSILITFLLFVLILVSLFLVLVVLMQRASSSGGLGAAFGGGMTESAFGAETGNVLTKATIYASATFFVLSLGLYLLIMSSYGAPKVEEGDLPEIGAATEQAAAQPEAVESVPVETVGAEAVEEGEGMVPSGDENSSQPGN